MGGKDYRSTLEKLQDIFTKNFGPPFLKDGSVEAVLSYGTLKIRIGRRDVEINSNLEVIGSGTRVSEMP